MTWMRSIQAHARGNAHWHLMGAKLDWLPDGYHPRCGSNTPYRLHRCEVSDRPGPQDAVCVTCLALSLGLHMPTTYQTRRLRTAR